MRNLMMAAAFSVAAAIGIPAQATTVIGFDNIPDGGIVAGQYNGVVFSGASVLTQNLSLNPAYPPYSGSKLVYDYDNGTITLAFSTAVDSIGAYVTGNTAITLFAYDGATLLGSIATPGANYTGSTFNDPNIFLSLAFPTITSAVFTNGLGSGNTFTLDDVTIGGNVTVNLPEPASWAIMIVGMGILGGAMRQRRRMTVRHT